MDKIDAAGETEPLDNNYEFYISLKKRALSVVKINLLIYAAFIPAVAILFREEVTTLSNILSSPVTLVGLLISAVSIGSTGLTLGLIQLSMRKHMLSYYNLGGYSDEREELREHIELTDYVAITEVSTAMSAPMIFMGVASVVLPIDLSSSIIFILMATIGTVFIKSSIRNIFEVFRIIEWSISTSRIWLTSSLQDEDRMEGLNAAAVLAGSIVGVLVSIYTHPIVVLDTSTIALDVLLITINLMSATFIFILTMFSSFLVYSIILEVVDRYTEIDVPENTIPTREK
jgi:hypothetical protein